MKTVTRTVLIADEGMILTDGKDYRESVYLKVGADPATWREISKEEHGAIMTESGVDEV